MPIFDYRCPITGETFEALVRKPEDLPRCSCGTRSACVPERLPSAPAFHLKGTGWYKPGASG